MASNQLTPLLEKTWIVKKKSPVKIILETLTPFYFCFLLWVVFYALKKSPNFQVKSFPQSGPFPSTLITSFNVTERILGYSPNTPEVTDYMNKVCQSLGCTLQSTTSPTSWANVFVTSLNPLNYTIRMPATKVPSTSNVGPLGGIACFNVSQPCPTNSYQSNGFLAIQQTMNSISTDSITNYQVEQMVQPAFQYKPNLGTLAIIPPVYLAFSYSPLLIFVVTYLVGERQSGFKEILFLSGVKQWPYFASWWILTAVQMVVTSALQAVLLTISGTIFSSTPWLIIWITMMLYAWSVISLGLFLSTFFGSNKTAGSVSPFLLVIFIAIYYPISLLAPSLYWLQVLLSLFFPPVALALAISDMTNLEFLGTPVTYATWGLIGAWMACLVFATIFYFLMTLWMDGWNPISGIGYKSSPFWYLKKSKPVEASTTMTGTGIAISINGVTKSFPGVLALDSLSFDVKKGQICALLGHNGSGKSTLVSILSGTLQPDSGNATIFGLDSQVDAMKIRQITGLCPQKDVLLDELTAKQHLTLFSKIKGTFSKEAVDEMLQKVGLWEDANRNAKLLSGGNKRKTCLAMALIGNPQVLFLDEPTSGMDPSSRRNVWEMLLKYRNAHPEMVCLLTTHAMDEADLLADEKAILAHGKLLCMGNSLYLKRTFRGWYTLGLTVPGNVETIDNVQKEIQAIVPGATMTEAKIHVDETLSLQFALPIDATKSFKMLFEQLGDRHFNITAPNLEDVFLKLDTEEGHETLEKTVVWDSKEVHPVKVPFHPPSSASKMLTFFKIRWLVYIRQPRFLFMTLIFPIVLALIGCLMGPSTTSLIGGTSTPPPLLFGATTYSTGQWVASPPLPTTSVPLVSVQGDLNSYLLATPNNNGAFQGLTLIYNQTMPHSPPIMLASLSNSLTYSWPWPDTSLSFDTSSYISALLLGMALLLPPGALASETVREEETKIRHLLRIQGMSPLLYWTSVLLFDLCFYWIVVIACIIITIGFGFKAFGGAAIPVLLITLIVWTFVIIAYAHACSLVFDKGDTALSIMPTYLTLIGLLCYLCVSLLDQLGQPSLGFTIHLICAAFIPPYGILGILWYANVAYTTQLLTGTTLSVGGYFAWNVGILPVLIFSLIQLVLGIAGVYIWQNWKKKLELPAASSNKVRDEDVMAERSAVLTNQGFRMSLLDLEKTFKSKRRTGYFSSETIVKLAVNQVSLGIPLGQVVGLVGPNGAGKSTTFSIASGTVEPTSGKVTLWHNQDAFVVNGNDWDGFDKVGFVPQSDVLYPTLTAAEHVKLFSEFKGVDKGSLSSQVETILNSVQLQERSNVATSKLSGGQKRKACLAIALAHPDLQLLMLDEVSTGLDPTSRRQIWNVIKGVVDGDTSVFLTTHYLEEADFLSDRIAIMVNGQIQCVGSSSRLKEKFGPGYVLELEFPSKEAMEQERTWVYEKLPSSVAVDVFDFVVWRRKYQVTREDVERLGGMGPIFEMLEDKRLSGQILDYSFGEPSLESVFLKFAKKQE